VENPTKLEVGQTKRKERERERGREFNFQVGIRPPIGRMDESSGGREGGGWEGRKLSAGTVVVLLGTLIPQLRLGADAGSR